MLLEIAHRKLHIELVDVLFRDLFQSEEDRFQRGQIGDLFYLPFQPLQLIERIQVVRAHDVILHVYETFEKLAGSGRVTIALDGTPLTVSTGGVARYTLELARALAGEFPEDQYWLLSDQILPRLASLPANLHMGSPPKTLPERRWWLFGLDREMSRRGVDLFHGTDFSVPYLPRRPSVMTVHDLSPWTHADLQPDAVRVRRRTPALLRLGLASMVITPTEAVRREAIERFRLRPERVVAVPLAASPMFRRVEPRQLEVEQPGSTPAKPYFLFVGTLEPRKNIARLIEAWREVRKANDVDLVLAGRLRAGFPAPAPEPGLRVLGPVPEADLPGLYSGALACVYPSLYEGFGLPVLEAMQCGAVVVTSRDPAVVEISGGEVSGGAAVHVDATDTRALVEALAAVARAPENFAELRGRAIGRAAEFTWQRTARRTREVYEAARRVF
jgi:glycosyltransferase involved in cell wall biosynthesis